MLLRMAPNVGTDPTQAGGASIEYAVGIKQDFTLIRSYSVFSVIFEGLLLICTYAIKP